MKFCCLDFISTVCSLYLTCFLVRKIAFWPCVNDLQWFDIPWLSMKCLDNTRLNISLRNNQFMFSWFHGKITRSAAEDLLQPRHDGLFLVRESTNYVGDYTLCVCFEGQVEHYRIIFKENKVTIDEESYYENLTKLVEVSLCWNVASWNTSWSVRLYFVRADILSLQL